MSRRTRRAAWPLWPQQEREARRGRRPRPIVSWRVRARRSSRLSILVEVYKSRRDLRRASACDGDVTAYNRRFTIAECVEIAAYRQWWRGSRIVRRRKRPEFAIVRLTTKSRTRDIVHECFHATLRWARRTGETSLVLRSGSLKVADAPMHYVKQSSLEEQLAIVHENLVAGTVDGMFDFGFIE